MLALATATVASLWCVPSQAQSVNFAVDPYWMKSLPNLWVTGVIGGTCLGAQNHVFVVTQGFQTGGLASPEGVGGAIISGAQIGTLSASTASPPVIEFDQNGYVVNSWGNPALVPTGQPFAGQNAALPNGLHGCFVDNQGFVWVAGTADGVVQKYSHDGSQMLLQIGTKFTCDDGLGGAIPCTGTGGGNVGRTGSSQTLLNQPTAVAVDAVNGDVYIADGGGNHRVVVFDLAPASSLRQEAAIRAASCSPTTDWCMRATAAMTASMSTRRQAARWPPFPSSPARRRSARTALPEQSLFHRTVHRHSCMWPTAQTKGCGS
jgi:hypothetical protein